MLVRRFVSDAIPRVQRSISSAIPAALTAIPLHRCPCRSPSLDRSPTASAPWCLYSSSLCRRESSSCGHPIFLVKMSPTTPTVLALIVDEMTLHPSSGSSRWRSRAVRLFPPHQPQRAFFHLPKRLHRKARASPLLPRKPASHPLRYKRARRYLRRWQKRTCRQG